jgi:hypothetical protein
MAPLTSKELLYYLLEDNILQPNELDQFIQANPDENQYLDYKNGVITTRQQRRDKGIPTIREYMSGFANSDGGVLMIGIDEARPRQIAPCERLPGGQPLNDWASRCLHDMAGYFSPQPRFHTIAHPQGDVLAIAVARAPSLVPCVEAGELKYFFRIGDSTLRVPEWLIADLVLGRRQHPLLHLHHPADIRTDNKELKTPDGRDNIPARSATFSFLVENLSLITAENIKIGVVLWSLSDGAVEEINSHLRSYLDIEDINQSLLGYRLRLIHRSSISSEEFRLDPFQRLGIRDIGPFYFPVQVSARVIGAVYVIPEGAPPTWFQLDFGSLYGGMPTRTILTHFQPTLTRKGSERPRVAFIQE